eukprot:467039-Prorocentrum_minimum.AAC.1
MEEPSPTAATIWAPIRKYQDYVLTSHAALCLPPPQTLLTGLHREMESKCDAFNPQDLASTMRAHAALQASPQMTKWACRGGSLAFRLVSLTRAGGLQVAPPPLLLAALEAQTLRQVAAFKTQELGSVLWAYARLRRTPPPPLAAALLDKARPLNPKTLKP